MCNRLKVEYKELTFTSARGTTMCIAFIYDNQLNNVFAFIYNYATFLLIDILALLYLVLLINQLG